MLCGGSLSPGPEHVGGPLHVGLELEVEEPGVHGHDVAGLDGDVRGVTRQQVALPDHPHGLEAAHAQLQCLVLEPPGHFEGGGLAGDDVGPGQPFRLPARRPFGELPVEVPLERRAQVAEVPDQEFRGDEAVGIGAADRLHQHVPEGDRETVGFGKRPRRVDPDALGVPAVNGFPQVRRDSLPAVAVVDLLVVDLLDHRVPRLHMRAEIDLLGLRAPRVEEDVGGAHSGEAAPDLVVQRVRVVFPVEDDPHVDAVRPHRREQRRAEFLLDDRGLDPGPFEGSGYAVAGPGRGIGRRGWRRGATGGQQADEQDSSHAHGIHLGRRAVGAAPWRPRPGQ